MNVSISTNRVRLKITCCFLAFTIIFVQAEDIKSSQDPKVEIITPKIDYNLLKQINEAFLVVDKLNKYIRISGQTEVESFDDASGIFKYRHKVQFETYLKLGGQGKVAVILCPAGIYNNTLKTVSNLYSRTVFDGVNWFDFQEKEELNGKYKDVKQVLISTQDESSVNLDDGVLVGSIVDIRRFKFSFFGGIEQSLKGGYQTSINGDTVKLTEDNECTFAQLLLRKDLTFAPISFIKRGNLCNNKLNQLEYKYDFNHYKRCGDFYYPSAVSEIFSVNGIKTNVLNLTIKDVSFVNDDKANAALDTKISEGWIVNDRRSGVAFKAGKDPKATINGFNKQ